MILFALFASRVAVPAPAVAAISATEVPAPIVAAAEPAIVEVAVAADVAMPEFAAAAAPVTGSGECVVAERIRSALRDSPATPAALAAIPPEARTVANAVMLWDGQWTRRPTREGGDRLTQLRELVVTSIHSAPAECLSAPINGPRLVIVPDGASSVVLAFGSGTWSWSELVQ